MIRPLICEWGDIEHEKDAAEMIAKNGLEGHRVMVFDGSIHLEMRVFWCAKTPGESPHHQTELKEYPGWYKRSLVMFSNSEKFSEKDFDSIKQTARENLINPDHMFDNSKRWATPNEISLEQRQRIAEMVLDLKLEIPDVPKWLFPIPVAAIGEVPQHSAGRYASFLCEFTDEFAVIVNLNWSLAERDATEEEIEILEEQLK
jgi:hypothetical protein